MDLRIIATFQYWNRALKSNSVSYARYSLRWGMGLTLLPRYNRFGSIWFCGISTIVGHPMPNPFYTYILNQWDLVWFYGISTIVGYSMPNPLYTYTLTIFDLFWFVLILWHINHYWLFNAKSFYLCINYIWFGLVWSGFMAYKSLQVI